MTDKEKIEELLDFMVELGEGFDCDKFIDTDEGRWCYEHCKWGYPQKPCYRHFILGE